jgi:tight adherence protein B
VLIPIAFFLAILGLFFGVYWLFVLRSEEDAEQRLARRLKPNVKVGLAERLSLLRHIAPQSAVPLLDKVLARSAAVVKPLERTIERTGLSLTVGTVVLACGFLFVLSFFVALQMIGMPLIALVISLMAGSVPILVVRWLARRRVVKFEEQFPEAIDLIARGLRAGHALTTALAMVVDEAPEPVRGEFRLLYDRQNFGMPMGEALKAFAERVGLLDARFFVTAVMTQRESGGNLAEVLDSLAMLIRERFRLKRQVRVVSAHGRITGWVLAALPVALTGIMFLVAPSHISQLFTDPLGLRMVAVAAVLQVIGVLAMRRITNIEI